MKKYDAAEVFGFVLATIAIMLMVMGWFKPAHADSVWCYAIAVDREICGEQYSVYNAYPIAASSTAMATTTYMYSTSTVIVRDTLMTPSVIAQVNTKLIEMSTADKIRALRAQIAVLQWQITSLIMCRKYSAACN